MDEFVVDGIRYTLAAMLEANADDPAVSDWCRTAKPGDVFPALVQCECVKAE